MNGMETENRKKLIAFAGGGTGGHVFPIIAVYQELVSLNEQFTFCYLGSKGKIEQKISEENKIPFYELPFIGGMPRSFKACFWFFKFFYALLHACVRLSHLKPKLVFSTGGYSAAPVICAAKLLNVPYVLHNLDAHLGLANKVFVSDCAALTLGMTLFSGANVLPKNGPCVITGNPIRQAFYRDEENKTNIYAQWKLDPKRKTLIVVGGSQGAEVININLLRITKELIEKNWQIIHQLGPLQYDKFKELFPDTPYYRAERFIDRLEDIYSIADLAVSRSGAMSVGELTAKKVPAILIPLPTAAQNHQYLNAKCVEEKGGAVVLEQKDLSDESLLEMIEYVYERQKLFRLNLGDFPFQNPAKNIGKIILRVMNKDSEVES